MKDTFDEQSYSNITILHDDNKKMETLIIYINIKRSFLFFFFFFSFDYTLRLEE